GAECIPGQAQRQCMPPATRIRPSGVPALTGRIPHGISLVGSLSKLGRSGVLAATRLRFNEETQRHRERQTTLCSLCLFVKLLALIAARTPLPQQTTCSEVPRRKRALEASRGSSRSNAHNTQEQPALPGGMHDEGGGEDRLARRRLPVRARVGNDSACRRA